MTCRLTSEAQVASVLVIDDAKFLRTMVADGLTVFKHDVYQAQDGQEALSIIKKLDNKLDVIVCDISMPGMNGLELAQIVKTFWSGIFIILSAQSYGHHVKTAVSIGVDAFLAKPAKINKINASIIEAQRKRELVATQ